ncbi:MAG: hypothetical protein RL748_4333 [Pseudomonadota bacterium]|jgi:uncharacterized protein (TIGR02285 family)
MTPCRATLPLLLLLWSSVPAALAQEPITLYYHNRPPYLVADASGTVSGLSATPAERAFKQAKIPFVWASAPTNRQLFTIKQNKTLACSAGWFKTPERETFAKYTKPIYRDLPAVLIANPAFQLATKATLAQVLTSKGTRVLHKENFSYGPVVDDLLKQGQVQLVQTTDENAAMLKMVRMNMADFMFAAKEEAQYLMEEQGGDSKQFKLIHLPDMPPGEYRYIMCSKLVPDEVIAKLNAKLNAVIKP